MDDIKENVREQDISINKIYVGTEETHEENGYGDHDDDDSDEEEEDNGSEIAYDDFIKPNPFNHHPPPNALCWNKVEMRELKSVPTQIFWIRLALLVPLLPMLSLVVYPYYTQIQQFQTNWAVVLLAFKSGSRWTSLIIQPHLKNNLMNNYWNQYQSWEYLFSTILPPLMSAMALQLSFPSSFIIITFAYMKTFCDEFMEQDRMPSGYTELEIISCVFTLVFLFLIFSVNVFFYV